MKKFFTVLSLLIFVCSFLNITKASNPGNETNEDLYQGSAYHPGLLVVKIKSQYRGVCSQNNVALAGLKSAMAKISATGVTKKFKHIQAPKEKYNKAGQKLVDLSLVYEIRYSPIVRIESAIQIINATGVVEYAEPLYIHKLDFTPNDPSAASQYHIAKIQAYSAWDLWKGDTNVVVGIVDSGTDWDHPDLEDNIKYNYADPIDGLDNDNDGFIDNFRGWDVSENDNNPMVGASTHGSHVSGCASAVTDNATGVASPGFNCKFLPVKSTQDASAFSIDNGYDGIVYAADHGSNIINCSWGRSGGSASIFEQETINYATFNKDALVVAAAGNNIFDSYHYPGSYDYVTCIAATNSADTKASFSNFHLSVDVSAPGDNILATNFNDTYATEDGTSMSAPIAAGCAALIKSRFPSFNALQIGEQLRATADNIYANNAAYLGKLGSGRVNLFRAVTDSLCPGVIMRSQKVTDHDDEIFMPGDTLSITGLFENLLRPTTSLTCSLVTNSNNVTILQPNFNAGVMNTFDTLTNFSNEYRVYVKPTAPLNSVVTFRVVLTDGTWSDMFLFQITVNVDYVNIAINNVGTSVNSKSMLGYNQPGQLQGLGFTFEGSATILYDMGLMVGAQGGTVSDNVRADAGLNDADFTSVQNVTVQQPGPVSDFDVQGIFTNNTDLYVHHRAYAWVNAPDDNYVMVQYFIKNTGTTTLNNLWAGLFADWDIPDFTHNKCSTDNARKMGYIWCTDSAGLWAGMKLLSHTGSFNHYALDNTAANGGIEMTDGYSNADKYQSLSTGRADAGTATTVGNDVLSVVSTGAFNLAPGDSVEVAFALIAGRNLASIQVTADAAQTKYDNIFIGITPVGNANSNQLNQCYPNPANKEVTIEFGLKENSFCELTIFNLLGEKMKTVVSEKLSSGKYSVPVDVSNLPAGNYFYRLNTPNYVQTLPMNIVH
jgi:hypothetical protein